MSDPMQKPTPAQTQPSQERVPTVFAERPVEGSRRGGMLAVGAGVVAVILIAVAVAMHNHTAAPESAAANQNQILPIHPYAGSLALSGLTMSQSTSLSGGTSTFIDGKIRNSGGQTLTGVTVQVLFPNDEGSAPQMETVALALIRAHEPYVDTQPVSMAPIKPGEEKEFRLIFERVPDGWNQQLPEIHVVKVSAQ
jgi:hypothetical protein